MTDKEKHSEYEMFVINGFYMDLRAAYVAKGASIHYYLVSWDQAKLSWVDFRAKVLGATDPNDAQEGSLRNTCLK